MSKHYVVFIHGIGERNSNDSPSEQNVKLWNMLFQKSGMSQEEFEQKFLRIDTDWHVGPLKTAAETIQNAAFPSLKEQFWNPMRGLRDFMTFFLGDVTAYVSEDVNFIRRTVWKQIWDKLKQPIREEGTTYSIVAHSLGAVIAFDYLFDLFEKNQLFVPPLTLEEKYLEKIDIKDENISIDDEDKKLLQEKFRHFFTLGSPLAIFMLRKGSLWYDKEKSFARVRNPVRGQNRVWHNFFDGQDIIAYPLENLFKINPENDECNFKDLDVETGFLIVDSHNNYWQNEKLAADIIDVLVGK